MSRLFNGDKNPEPRHGRGWLALLALLPLGAAAVAQGVQAMATRPQPPEVKPLWACGFEAGLGDWHVSGANDEGLAPALVTARAREGRFAARFDIPEGGQRNEVSARGLDPLFAFTEGEDLYFAASYFFDGTWPTAANWQIVAQWKQVGEGTPPVQLAAEGDALVLRGKNWQSRQGVVKTLVAPLPRDRWVDVVVRLKFSTRLTVGFAEAWVDGEPVLTETPWETLHAGRPFSYMKAGIYRDTATPGATHMWMDAWRIGTSYEAVAGR